MDRYTRYNGGSAMWSIGSCASTIINNEFFGTTPTKAFHIKVSGVWKQCNTYIKILGAWVTATPMIIKTN